jgi:hypothetical protein
MSSEEDKDKKKQYEAILKRDLTPEEIYEVLDKEATPPIAHIPTIRCACGYKKPITEMPLVHTGVIPQAISNICKSCERDASPEYAHLCCVKCKEIWWHIEEQKGDHGFRILRGKYYHTAGCPQCSDAGSAPIIEQILFYKKNNLPYHIPSTQQKKTD